MATRLLGLELKASCTVASWGEWAIIGSTVDILLVMARRSTLELNAPAFRLSGAGMPPMLTGHHRSSDGPKGVARTATWLLALPFARCCWRGPGPGGMGSRRGLSFWWAPCCSPPDPRTRLQPPPSLGTPVGCSWWPYRKGLSHASVLSHSRCWATGWYSLATWRLLALGWQRCCSFSGGRPQGCLGWGGSALCAEQRPLVLSALVG